MRPRISWANVTETGSQANARTRTRARIEGLEQLDAVERLLGELLGRVLVEYAGQPMLDDVEWLRELSIAGVGEGGVLLVASWPHEHRVFALKYGTTLCQLLNASVALGWIDRRVEGRHPAFGVRLITDRRYDEQIASARRGNVSDPLAFLLFPRDLECLVIVEILGRPPSDAQRT